MVMNRLHIQARPVRTWLLHEQFKQHHGIYKEAPDHDCLEDKNTVKKHETKDKDPLHNPRLRHIVVNNHNFLEEAAIMCLALLIGDDDAVFEFPQIARQDQLSGQDGKHKQGDNKNPNIALLDSFFSDDFNLFNFDVLFHRVFCHSVKGPLWFDRR